MAGWMSSAPVDKFRDARGEFGFGQESVDITLTEVGKDVSV